MIRQFVPRPRRCSTRVTGDEGTTRVDVRSDPADWRFRDTRSEGTVMTEIADTSYIGRHRRPGRRWLKRRRPVDQRAVRTDPRHYAPEPPAAEHQVDEDS